MKKPTKQPDSAAVSVLDHALALVEQGLWVFPCSADKRPRTKHGHLEAVGTAEEATALFTSMPGPLIGVKTGKDSGIFVVDHDSYKLGHDVPLFAQLRAEGLLPPTRVHKTRNGGEHWIYTGDDFPNLAPAEALEIKGEGGYIIWWPAEGCEVVSEGIAEAPAGLVARLRAYKDDRAQDSMASIRAAILRAENLHDSLARLAARMIASGAPQEQVSLDLIEALRGSVASSPHHERHERWRELLADKNQELSRIITTANSKYSAFAMSDDLADLLAMKATAALAEKVGFKQVPKAGEEAAVAYDGSVWPFEGDGYFAHTDHELLKQRFIMHPILCEDESVLVAAEPKTGKTAICLTVGLHIACGMHLGDSLKVAEPRSVLYFGLEGRRAIRLRIAAWRRYQEEQGAVLPDHIPLFVVERGQNLMGAEERAVLVNKIAGANSYMTGKGLPELGAIFIDTFTKSMPGGDQNSVEDTSLVFDIVQQIRGAGITASIVFIHHKARAGNVRGSTNIEADPDVLTSISKEANAVRWNLERARSVEEGGSYLFELVNYDLGISEQGFGINAPVVVAKGVTESDSGLSSASVTAAMLKIIIAMGDGRHGLQDVLRVLHEKGFGPQQDVTKRAMTRAARFNSAAAQTFINDLIPDTGYVFGTKSVRKDLDGDLVVSLSVR